MDVEQLETLLAVVDAGSFDDASIDLGITASAVSQRIKALENRLGAVLLVRSRPVIATEQGTKVLRYARQMSLLSAEFSKEIASEKPIQIAIGVNADSLSTWFGPVFSELAKFEDLSCEIVRTDENRGLELLRTGRVSAVVTNSEENIQGCISEKLGAMRYRAAAQASVAQRHVPTGTADELVHAPMVVFDREDPLQHLMLERAAGAKARPAGQIHHVPDSMQFVAAIEAGMGWGMVPEPQLQKSHGLQVLNEQWHMDVPLYFQRWAVDSEILKRIGGILVTAARQHDLHLLA